MEKEFGFVGLGSRLVTFDPAYRNIVYNLLGRTVVVEDLDCGIAMARKYRNAFRIVTLDGQVINRGGSMTGGSTSRSAGVLSRSAELEQLTARTAAMQAKLAEAKQAEEDTARELAAAQYELETAEAQRATQRTRSCGWRASGDNMISCCAPWRRAWRTSSASWRVWPDG